MFDSVSDFLYFVFVFLAAALISAYAVRKILFVTRSRSIFDLPDDSRKVRGAQVPSLGGIGIFIGYMLVASLYLPGHHYWVLWVFVPGSLLLFFTGIYDDLVNMSPPKKLVAQLIAAAIPVLFANARIFSLHGLFGIEELPMWGSVLLTTLGGTLFINAFNFVDGIDGLACVSAIFYTLVLGCLLLLLQAPGLATLAFCLAGATVGLWAYNREPARIYMGDTGSMLLGYTIFLLALEYMHVRDQESAAGPSGASLVVALALLIMPVFDALRVFILRASKGVSPLRADRAHLHYYLLDAGLSHNAAVTVILSVNILVVLAGVLLQHLPVFIPLMVMTLITALAHMVIYRLRQRRMARRWITHNPEKQAEHQSADSAV